MHSASIFGPNEADLQISTNEDQRQSVLGLTQVPDDRISSSVDRTLCASEAVVTCLQENVAPQLREAEVSGIPRTRERQRSSTRSKSSETLREKASIKPKRRASTLGSQKDGPRLPPFLGRHPSCAQIRCVSLPPIREGQVPAHFDWTREPVYYNGPDWPGYIKVPQAVPTEVSVRGIIEEEYPLQHRRSSTDSQRSTRGGSVMSMALSDIESIDGEKKITRVVKHAVRRVETLFSKATYKDGCERKTK